MLAELTKFYSETHLSRVRKDVERGIAQNANYYSAHPERAEEYRQRSEKEWSAEAVAPRVAQFLKEIQEKDVAALTAKNNGMFEVFWRVFQKATGIYVPKTQKGIAEMLRQYVGAEAYDAHQAHQAKKRGEKLASQEKEREEMAFQVARSLAADIRIAGVACNGAEWVESQINDGWRVERCGSGAVPVYRFTKDGRVLKAGKGWAPLISYGRLYQAKGGL